MCAAQPDAQMVDLSAIIGCGRGSKSRINVGRIRWELIYKIEYEAGGSLRSLRSQYSAFTTCSAELSMPTLAAHSRPPFLPSLVLEWIFVYYLYVTVDQEIAPS